MINSVNSFKIVLQSLVTTYKRNILLAIVNHLKYIFLPGNKFSKIEEKTPHDIA